MNEKGVRKSVNVDEADCVKANGLRVKPLRKRNRKVVWVSDSQGRGCAEVMRDGLGGRGWGVDALVMPGATAERLLGVARDRVDWMSAKDCLVVLSGVNGLNEESVNRIGEEMDLLASKVRTNLVVFVEAPLRYDGVENRYIKVQNLTIRNKCIEKKWAYISLNSMLERSSY